VNRFFSSSHFYKLLKIFLIRSAEKAGFFYPLNPSNLGPNLFLRNDHRNVLIAPPAYPDDCEMKHKVSAANALEVKMTVYRVIVFLHVLSALGFLMAHGVSAMMLFKVSRERSYDALCNYLEISSLAMKPAMLALHGVEITGITLTLMGRWWMMGWIWVALALFIGVGFVMAKYAAGYMNNVRRAMGIPSHKDLKKGLRPVPAPYEKLMEVVATGRPRLVATAALSGLAMIVALMTLKPF
jgi:hypothetical protein